MLRFTRLPSSALRLTGPDRLDFVQGQMTAHLKAAPTPGMVPACFLNVRGQIEQFARVYRREDDVYLHLDDLSGTGNEAAALTARFKKYIIFDQVQVQDVSAVLSSLHLWSEELSGWEASGPDVQSFELGGGALLVGRVNRAGTPGLDVHFLQKHGAGLFAALNAQAILAQEVPHAELDAARIAAAISDVVRDGWQGSLPQEVGQGAAMSYRKGCYVGQEIMARLEARGNARHALTLLTGEQLPAHSEIRYAGRVVGQSGASTGTLALAKLRKELPEGAELRVGEAVARVAAGVSAPDPTSSSPA